MIIFKHDDSISELGKKETPNEWEVTAVLKWMIKKEYFYLKLRAQYKANDIVS